MTLRRVRFADSGEVTGRAFLGRREEMKSLRERVLEAENSSGTVIIGPTRIGKGSLVANALPEGEVCGRGVLYIKMVVRDHSTAFDFWDSFCEELEAALRRYGRDHGDRREDAEDALSILAPARSIREEGNWYSTMRNSLRRTLRYLGGAEIPLVLILDEFDSATRIFGREGCYYSFLRTLSTSADYRVSCVLLARHELHTIELRERGDSNFAGAYMAFPLRQLDGEGMEDYRAILEEGGVELDREAWESLHHYAGQNPYLLSLLGNRLGDLAPECGSRTLTEEDVDGAFRRCRRAVQDYCTALRDGMQKDGDLIPLMGATVAPCIGVSREDRQRMQDLGYLDTQGTCAISPYFTEFLRTAPLDLGPMEGVLAAERKLRELAGRVYPWLAQVRYESEEEENSLWRQIEKHQRTCPDFDLVTKRKTVLRTMRQYFSWWGEISLLNALSLGYVLNEIILPNWEKFRPLMGNREVEAWRDKLELIGAARGPLAHANGSGVEGRRNELKLCCDEILSLP